MPHFMKKRVVVEATQWFPGVKIPGLVAYGEWDEANDRPAPCRWFDADGRAYPCQEGRDAFVTTIHGQQTHVVPGDWIITEPDGIHHYPCKPDIFAATYEPVEKEGGEIILHVQHAQSPEGRDVDERLARRIGRACRGFLRL